MVSDNSNRGQGKQGVGQQFSRMKKQPTTLRWNYNYFTVEEGESFNDWRDRLPISIREVFYDDEF